MPTTTIDESKLRILPEQVLLQLLAYLDHRPHGEVKQVTPVMENAPTVEKYLKDKKNKKNNEIKEHIELRKNLKGIPNGTTASD